MNNRIAGYCLVFAAITFWIAWFLMPDAGTNDPAHILDVVSRNRSAVWGSVVIQIVSSVAFVPGIVGLNLSLRRVELFSVPLGASLILIGAMGMCADAFFHMTAYYMTADTVVVTAMLEPMRLIQTQGIRLLLPLLLPFFVGGWVYARALREAAVVSPWPARIFAAAFGFALAGVASSIGLGVPRHVVALSFLGIIALGYLAIGFELILKPSGREGDLTDLSRRNAPARTE